MESASPMVHQDAPSGHSVAPIPDRVNAEPAIIKGLSLTESKWAIGLAVLLWLPVGGLVGLAVQQLPVALLIIATGPIATVWLAAGQMAKLKRNRPDHYYLHLLLHWAASARLIRSEFVTHSGAWDMGRTLLPARAPRSRPRTR